MTTNGSGPSGGFSGGGEPNGGGPSGEPNGGFGSGGIGRHPGHDGFPDHDHDWHFDRDQWRAEREMWRLRRVEMRRRGGRRHRVLPPVGCIGCAIVGFVLVVGSTAAFATWVVASVLGFLIPSAGPNLATGIAIAAILLVAIGVSVSAFAQYVRPLASLAEATRRLGDGEPEVRVWVRGPRPVRDLAASFNAAAERLDRSRTARQALLADVTHELRTPLTVISGGIEAMLDGVHPTDEDHLAPLLAETQVMDRLLEDLRTLSLAEAGALALHREPADLVDIAGDAVSALRPVASAKGVQLRLGGEATLETSVDPVRVREIVTNLLTNAIRHTPAGGDIDVTLRSERGAALIEVRDTGDGISAEDLPHVFDRFQRRADSGGSGLGLTIVRDLAAAHGGTVDAASEGPGRGATFRVRLPIRD